MTTKTLINFLICFLLGFNLNLLYYFFFFSLEELIRKNLNLNETYDLEYNNPIHPEEKDKVIFDDLNTHKFKEKIQICLKEQLNSPFLMDEFFKNKYNKVNFLYDNFYVPQIQNKLNFLNLDSVLFLLNQEKSLFKI